MKRTLCGVHLAPERPGTMCQEARHKKLQFVSSFQFTNEGAEFLATYTYMQVVSPWVALFHLFLTCILKQFIKKKEKDQTNAVASTS